MSPEPNALLSDKLQFVVSGWEVASLIGTAALARMVDGRATLTIPAKAAVAYKVL